MAGWVFHVIDRIDRRRRRVAVAIVAMALLACWMIAVASGSAIAVSRHWFYVPVVFAAVRFGYLGAIAVGALASLLAGPLVPGAGVPVTDIDTWGVRGGFLIGVGAFVAGLVTVLRDSLERNLVIAEQERELAVRQTTFIQTVSHEFRTPLTILHGGIQTLQRHEARLDDRLQPLVASLARAQRRLDEMVAVVLAAAEDADIDQRAHAEPVRLSAIVDEVAHALEHIGGPNRIVLMNSGDDLIVTVPAYLRLALHSLLENALRFSPSDQPVTVTTRRTDQAIEIAVRDRGSGIDPTYLSRALRPFTQGDASSRREHGGLGLGLFIARKLVERLDGELRIDTSGAGVSTTVTLPQRRHADDRQMVRPSLDRDESHLPPAPTATRPPLRSG